MGIFFYCNEASFAQTIWQLLRPLAIAILSFYLIRSPKVAAWIVRRSQNSASLRRLVKLAKLSQIELIQKLTDK